MLITQDSANGNAFERAGPCGDPGGRGNYLGEECDWDSHRATDLLAPLQSSKVQQHGPRRVGYIGHMTTSAQVPQHPRIDGAEAEIPVFRPGPQPRVPLEDPRHLGTGEIGGEGQTGRRSKDINATGSTQPPANFGRTGVLPDDRVMNRTPRFLVPDHRRLTLVGDTHRGEARGSDPGLVEGGAYHSTNLVDNFDRIVFDPARLGKYLRVFLPGTAHHLAGAVEDHEAGTRRSLIQGADQRPRHRVRVIRAGRKDRPRCLRGPARSRTSGPRERRREG